MEDFVKERINEHKDLCQRIVNLEDFIIRDGMSLMSKEEFAAANVQLTGMKTYAEALGIRLYYAGITIINGDYLSKINTEDPKEAQDNEA